MEETKFYRYGVSCMNCGFDERITQNFGERRPEWFDCSNCGCRANTYNLPNGGRVEDKMDISKSIGGGMGIAPRFGTLQRERFDRN